MKRSEINMHIRNALALFDDVGFTLPPFATWSPAQWQKMDHAVDEIRDNGLGWDVTDYGLNRFSDIGLLLFTLRNGNYAKRQHYPKGYAEKIMVVQELQVTPWHYHWNKREDIINRGGGELEIVLSLADENNYLAKSTFTVRVDGVERQVQSGGKIILTPGESICLEPYVYHTFYGRPGRGPVVVGEVSDVNDDDKDNCFLEDIGRFPAIIEDEPPLYYLCNEYPEAPALPAG